MKNSTRFILVGVLGLSSISLSSCFLLDAILGTDNGDDDNNKGQEVEKGFNIYRSDTNQLLDENTDISVLPYYDFYFTCKLDGTTVTPSSITVTNTSIFVPHRNSVYPSGNGNTNVTISYVNTQVSPTQTLSKTFKLVSDYNDVLEDVYVGNGAAGLEVSTDNTLKINGRVYAKFANKIERCINENSNLTTSVENGQNSQTRKVTLTYTYGGKSASKSYQVPVTTESTLKRTKIQQDFYTYNANGYVDAPLVKNEGTVNVLALPIWFTDSSTYINTSVTDRNGLNQKEQILEDLQHSLFDEPTRKDYTTLKSYYYEESFGKMNIQGKVADWYNSSYSTSTNFYSNANARRDLAVSAFESYKDNNPSDTTEYDCVLYFYGSTQYGGSSNPYTAFQYYVEPGVCEGLCRYTFVGALNMYNLDSEDPSTYYNASDLSDLLSNDSYIINTLLHEFGHTMGAVDLYDNGARSGTSTIKYNPGLQLTMQCDNVNSHDMYNQLGMGFTDPYVLDATKYSVGQTVDVTISNSSASGDVVIFTNKWNENDSIFDEYMMLELFSETGLNRIGYNANRNGVRLFHVDSKLLTQSLEYTTDATTPNAFVPYTNTTNKNNGSTMESLWNIDLVHQIRANVKNKNGETIGYKTTESSRDDSWFKKGDIFTMEKYKSQFYFEGLLDDEESTLNWEFKVLDLSLEEDHSSTATIRFKRV